LFVASSLKKMTGEEAYKDMTWWMIYNATIGMMAWPQMLLIGGDSTNSFS